MSCVGVGVGKPRAYPSQYRVQGKAAPWTGQQMYANSISLIQPQTHLENMRASHKQSRGSLEVGAPAEPHTL